MKEDPFVRLTLSVAVRRKQNLHWNWILVAKGASCEEMKERLVGMWSEGRGPSAAKFDRFRAVMTVGRH